VGSGSLVVAGFSVLALAGGRPSDNAVTQRITLGTSVEGRAIQVVERGDPDSAHRMLVVGVIHGDEPAGIAIAKRLESMTIPRETDLWVIEAANPDGVARDTRTNAHGVDLNRNFPWHWRARGRPGNRYYAGPHALSEPESKMLVRFIDHLRPETTIWFHQPYGLIDESGGDVALERRFAALTGLPLRRLPRYPGGVTNWQNATFPGTTAFVVELNAGPLSAQHADQFARAVLAVAPHR
jgi:protein MpaA